MLRVTVLGSGSRGNAVLIDGSEGAVLVDCGFAARTLASRLEAAQRHPEQVHAVVLTHEHVDHACGVRVASARWNWPVYASALTHAALASEDHGAPAHVSLLEPTVTTVAGLQVEHHAVPHDAADCRALRFTDTRSGARVGVVLDCGAIPSRLPAFLAHCDLLVIESNHCATMLANGPYPRLLKQRIRGGHGHLSNEQAGRLLSEVAHDGLRGVMLAHLSETNNTPSLAVAAAKATLQHAGWRRDAVWAAPQRAPHDPVLLSGTLGFGPAQLTLAL
jgi:phosphoribosyl 1,2-cyclic phosphodiesterase